jgi:hypothetical protein
MLFVSEDKTKFICTDINGSPCFSRGEHIQLAKHKGLNLDQMTSLTMAFKYTGKGLSIAQFLEGV